MIIVIIIQSACTLPLVCSHSRTLSSGKMKYFPTIMSAKYPTLNYPQQNWSPMKPTYIKYTHTSSSEGNSSPGEFAASNGRKLSRNLQSKWKLLYSTSNRAHIAFIPSHRWVFHIRIRLPFFIPLNSLIFLLFEIYLKLLPLCSSEMCLQIWKEKVEMQQQQSMPPK